MELAGLPVRGPCAQRVESHGAPADREHVADRRFHELEGPLPAKVEETRGQHDVEGRGGRGGRLRDGPDVEGATGEARAAGLDHGWRHIEAGVVHLQAGLLDPGQEVPLPAAQVEHAVAALEADGGQDGEARLLRGPRSPAHGGRVRPVRAEKLGEMPRRLLVVGAPARGPAMPDVAPVPRRAGRARVRPLESGLEEGGGAGRVVLPDAGHDLVHVPGREDLVARLPDGLHAVALAGERFEEVGGDDAGAGVPAVEPHQPRRPAVHEHDADHPARIAQRRREPGQVLRPGHRPLRGAALDDEPIVAEVEDETGIRVFRRPE
jgi:hypothetical protein